MSTLHVHSRRRSGFTLIEVAIALALFVFGALAIVRIFPPALGVIRNNEYRSTATQMSQTTLAKMSSGVSSVPDAVYNIDPATGAWSDTDKAVFGTATKNYSLPKTPIDTNSALDVFKYIRGEHHVFKTAGGTSYVLLNFPTSSTQVSIYQEDTIEGVQIGSNGTLNFSNAYSTSTGQAFHDTSPTLVTHPPANKTGNLVNYYVSYRWRYSGQAPQGVISEPLILPSGNWTGDQGKVLQGLVSSSNQIIPGGISVRYRQYWGYSSPSAAEAALGYLNLTTQQHQDNVDADPSLIAGKQYSYDYTVSDWRNLVSDDAPSPTSSANAQVSLPVKNLDKVDTSANVDVYGLLTSGAIAPTLVAPTLTRSNFKNGTVPYDTSAYVAARTRTVYRTLDVWTHQISVASRSYVPFYKNAQFTSASPSNVRPITTPIEAWREYYWDGTGNLLFHVSEAGKTVALSFIDSGTGKTVNSVCTIGDKQLSAGVFGIPAVIVPPETRLFASSGQVVQLQITDAAGNIATPSSILSIRGLSVSARTAWLNNDRYNQVLVPGYRALTN